MRPLSSANGMKSCGKEQSPGGVLPPHQCFHPDECLGVKIHKGLVVQLQLIALEGAMQTHWMSAGD